MNCRKNNLGQWRQCMIRVAIILLSLLFHACKQHDSNGHPPRIEVYFLNEYKPVSDSSFYFEPTENQIADTPFIYDAEILGYEIQPDTSHNSHNEEYNYYILLSKSGQQKIRQLENIPLDRGIPFAITVDRVPVYGGYFWNIVSSFSCDWIVATGHPMEKLEIASGLPDYYFTKEYPDPRHNDNLIDALNKTDRLIEE